MNPKRRPGQTVRCDTCQTEFSRAPSKLAKSKGKFCSRSCMRFTRPSSDPMARVMSRVQKEQGGCWLWIGLKNKDGYGRFAERRNRMVLVHRWLYEQTTGEPIAGLVLMHKCDTPACVNPDHLTPGSHADNAKDMFAKGRWANQFAKGPSWVAPNT